MSCNAMVALVVAFSIGGSFGVSANAQASTDYNDGAVIAIQCLPALLTDPVSGLVCFVTKHVELKLAECSETSKHFKDATLSSSTPNTLTGGESKPDSEALAARPRRCIGEGNEIAKLAKKLKRWTDKRARKLEAWIDKKL